MKKVYAFILALSFCSILSAQVKSGFYRVQNDGTGTFVYICDNTGKAELKGTNVILDLDAIYLRKGLENAISDPGSVIYFDQVGGSYNFLAQGTSSYDICQHYLSLTERNGLYALAAEEKGVRMFLTDNGNNPLAPGYGIISNVESGQKFWKVLPVSSDSENFFGVAPKLKSGNKYYTSFFASFAFKPVSSSTKIYYVKEFSDAAVLLQEVSGNVSSKSPVIIEGTSNSASDNKLDLLSEGSALSDNKLIGVYFDTNNNVPPLRFVRAKIHTNQTEVKSDFRVLSVNDKGELVFTVPTTETVPANSAYLKVSNSANKNLVVFFNKSDYDSYTSNSIENLIVPDDAENVYDLLGKKVINNRGLSAGIYIIDGKKTIIR